MSHTAAARVASPARIAANKANALHSTGPRTPEGKTAISNNAFKHGLRSERNPLDLANDATLPAEREEFLATLEAFMGDLHPHGPLETRLVERLAQIDLRLNRAVRMETTHLDMHTGLLAESMRNALPPDEQTRHNWLTTLAFLKNPSASTLLAQYESRLGRDFARTLTQLRQAQKLRAQHSSQNLSNQTQPAEMPTERTVTVPGAIPTRSHTSDGMVADVAAEIPAEQTQSPGHPSELNHLAATPSANSSPQ